MKDVNQMRLQRMAERYERERAARGEGGESDAEREAVFLREFAQVRADVLRPLIDEIGGQLRSAGHEYTIEEAGPGELARLDWFLKIRGRSGSKDLIQFIIKNDPVRGRELVSEIVLKRSPVELKRFRKPRDITADVAEQLLVDAIDHLFASPPR